jgi:hypothetical protein
MEDEQHQHFVRQESKSGSQAKEDSPSHSHNKGELPMRKRESGSSSHEHHHVHHSSHAETTTSTAITSMIPESIKYNINVQFDRATPQAGKSTILSLVVTEQRVGEIIKQFDIIHDKLMHLIIVNSEDLSHFAHIHPRLDKETGIFHITHTFAKAGKYKMWIDAKPKDGIQILTAFAFNVEGQPVHYPASITHEQTRVKNVVADGQSYQVTLNCQPERLVVSRNVKMTFEITDANGKPIHNLQPLMAAGGHCVIINAGAREFLHVHPAEEVDNPASWRGGPSVSFLANFPKTGLYRAWGQFQHEGRLITVDFTFEVVAG